MGRRETGWEPQEPHSGELALYLPVLELKKPAPQKGNRYKNKSPAKVCFLLPKDQEMSSLAGQSTKQYLLYCSQMPHKNSDPTKPIPLRSQQGT